MKPLQKTKNILNKGVEKTVSAKKKLVGNYNKKTPKRAKQIGDGLILVSALVTLFVPGAKWAICAGLIGKYITECFGED